MPYEPKKFDALIGTPGFSDTLLKNHFTLYEGYVKNVNGLGESLQKLAPGTPEYGELKRRFGWEWNGMRLHELYFGNMSKVPTSLEGLKIPSASEGPRTTPLESEIPSAAEGKKTIAGALDKFWGNTDGWLKDFKATGTMRGIGWTILYHDLEQARLFNAWVNEHDMGHLTGCTPLLVLDVFEHAYIGDYGLKRADYIDAFIKAIDWKTVSSRLNF